MITTSDRASESSAPEQSSEARPLLVVHRVSKTYGPVRALSEVSLEIRCGEVHAVVGENGAGKSTLMKIIAGEETPDSGEIRFDGRAITLRGPNDARAHRIAIVHQQFQLVDPLTVAENMCLDGPPVRRFFGFLKLLHHARMIEEAERQLAPFGLDCKVQARVRELSVAERQVVEISRALARRARLLILDEPTSALNAHEIEHLFSHVLKLRSEGVAIVLIAHSIDEVLSIADRITVLRDGRLIGTQPARDLDATKLVRMIVGRDLEKRYPKNEVTLGDPLLHAALAAEPGGHTELVGRRGEILGIPTYIGAAVRDVLALLSGERPSARNAIRLDGHGVGNTAVRGRIRAGICLVPGDATAEGLVPKMSVEENILLPNLSRFQQFGVVKRERGRTLVRDLINALDIRPADPSIPVERLSGGNRQKVVIAKWLAAGAKVLLMDDPTRGVDVGAKVEIYRVIGDAVVRGSLVVLASSDLDELLGLADRIVVMRGGQIIEIFDRRPFDKAKVLARTAGAGNFSDSCQGGDVAGSSENQIEDWRMDDV
jgi:ABC-type sugar transport system ATPase subunit